MGARQYSDGIAEFYDSYYGPQSDLEFYRNLAADTDGPVLEVGCGTGRIYLSLLKDDIDTDGIDVSPEMVSTLREKADDEGLDSNVRQADVTEFESDRSYALVIAPFRVFMNLLTPEDQLAALTRVYEALEPGGTLAFNVFSPDYDIICSDYGEWDERMVSVDGRQLRFRMRTEIADPVANHARLTLRIETESGDRVREESKLLNLCSRDTYDLLFRLSPFSTWSVYGGFDRQPLESTTQEMVWLAQKK